MSQNPFPIGDPLREEWDRQHDSEHPGEMHRGRMRMAERLVDAYWGTLRYAHGIGWHRWDGQRWAPDQDGYAARAVIDVIKTALRGIVDERPEDRKELLSDIRKCESARGVEDILKLASWIRPIATHATQLDADPWLFNVQNGTLDLHTLSLRPHSPADMITKVAGTGYHPGAEGPIFDAFITGILPDDEVRAYVQRLFGASMFGMIRDHVLPIFTGKGGNGKSTLVELVRNVFGGYAIAAEPDLLVETSSAHPTGTADLLGVRLATCEETDEGRRLAVATVKRLTGGTKIRARRMRQDFIEFDASHTFVLVTNRLPVIRGDDPAIWRRIQVVPFDVVVAFVDLELPEKLALEKTAVLSWIVDGHRAWVERGLDPPGAVQVKTQDYRTDSDPVTRFLAERTNPTPYGYARASGLWNEWRSWCTDKNERPGSEKDFGKALRLHGFESVRRNIGVVYTGLQLLSEEEEPSERERYP